MGYGGGSEKSSLTLFTSGQKKVQGQKKVTGNVVWGTVRSECLN